MKALLPVLLSLVAPLLAQSPAQLTKELKAKETAAKKDPEQLFGAAKWAAEKGLAKEAQRLYQAVLKLKPDHEGANLALGNALVDGKWLPAKEAEAARKKALAAEYAAKGFVDVDGVWVEKERVDDAKRGVFHHDGEVVGKQEKLALMTGRVRHPETGELIDAKDLEKAKNGFFPLAGEGRWVDLKEADAFHSDLKRPWVVRTAHGTILSTLPFAKLGEYKQQFDRGYEAALRLLGDTAPTPAHRPVVIIAATVDEFREYGTGLGDETSAASAFLMREEARAQLPMQNDVRAAICDGMGDLGPFNVRDAAGIATAYAKAQDAGVELPLWFLHGVGAHASRFENESYASFYGKRHVARGGVKNLKAWFASFGINPDMQPEEIVNNTFQAALLLDYARNGGDPDAKAALQAVADALTSAKKGGADKALAKLQALLIGAEEKVAAHLQKVISK